MDRELGQLLRRGADQGSGRPRWAAPAPPPTACGRSETRSTTWASACKTARIYDGSGLSTGDRLSAAQIVGPAAKVGDAGLEPVIPRRPAGGRGRAARSPTACAPARPTATCTAKTGTLNDASALSGYVNTANGHRILFSMIMNRGGMNVLAAHKLQDRICQLLAGSRAELTATDPQRARSRSTIGTPSFSALARLSPRPPRRAGSWSSR